MYLTLKDAKKHLNINDDFKEDDKYISGLIEASEQIVERHIDNKLDVIASKNGGSLPAPLLQAMKLMVGNLYENRESVTYGSAIQVPLSYTYILSLYKNYSEPFNV